MWTVYILKCCDSSNYTGCTSNITDRLARQDQSEIEYTYLRLPVELVVTINFKDKYQAYGFEKYLK